MESTLMDTSTPNEKAELPTGKEGSEARQEGVENTTANSSGKDTSSTTDEASSKRTSPVEENTNANSKRPKKSKKKKRNRNWHDFALKQSPNSVCLWLGQIPKRYASNKALTAIFSKSVPDNVYPPMLRRLVERSYKRDNELFAYAIVVCRDKAEADCVSELWNNKELAPGFVAEVKECTATLDKPGGEGKSEKQTNDAIPLSTIVSCLSRDSLLQLCDLSGIGRTVAAEVATKMESENRGGKSTLVEHVSQYYATVPEQVENHSGTMVPAEILEKLRKKLETLRWPPASHRRGVEASTYLVLRGEPLMKLYSELVEACNQLMAWVGDNQFEYSAIAVTRNFQGSPHIDHRDTSYQYAISLGDFGEGGELCVQEFQSDKRIKHVVDTRDKIAKVDGRYVHWVNPVDTAKGTRYSLIFYCTEEKGFKPVEAPFHQLEVKGSM